MKRPLPRKVVYGGYNSTGGTVIRDIFNDAANAISFTPEFRIFRENKGLFDLYNAIFEHGAPEKIDAAATEFLWVCDKLGRSTTWFQMGCNYDKFSNNVFRKAGNRLIEQLTNYTYPFDWYYFRFGDPSWRFFLEKIVNKLLKRSQRYREAYFLSPTLECFTSSVANFMNSFVEGVVASHDLKKIEVIGLHNALPFQSAKAVNIGIDLLGIDQVIIVDRDPRDVFLSLPAVADSRYLPGTGSMAFKAEKFCQFYRAVRREQDIVISHPKVRLYYLDQIILDYPGCLEKIHTECSLNCDVELRGKFFNPDHSRINIHLWERCSDEEMKGVRVIERGLREYLR